MSDGGVGSQEQNTDGLAAGLWPREAAHGAARAKRVRASRGWGPGER